MILLDWVVVQISYGWNYWNKDERKLTAFIGWSSVDIQNMANQNSGKSDY